MRVNTFVAEMQQSEREQTMGFYQHKSHYNEGQEQQDHSYHELRFFLFCQDLVVIAIVVHVAHTPGRNLLCASGLGLLPIESLP